MFNIIETEINNNLQNGSCTLKKVSTNLRSIYWSLLNGEKSAHVFLLDKNAVSFARSDFSKFNFLRERRRTIENVENLTYKKRTKVVAKQ